MNKDLYIFTNVVYDNMFKDLFPQYNLSINSISKLYENKNVESGIIFFDENSLNEKIQFTKLKIKFLLISNSPKHQNLDKDNILFLKAPLRPDQLIFSVENYLKNKELKIGDLQLINQRLINLENNKTCFLTNIEQEIIFKLITNKKCTKEYIKVNILNIKPTIQTNSIESHLTRIRKKLDIIKTKLTLNSKNDIVSIRVN